MIVIQIKIIYKKSENDNAWQKMEYIKFCHEKGNNEDNKRGDTLSGESSQ